MNTQATHTPGYTVRRQTELRSQQWGVYNKRGDLIEGGFFSNDGAEDCAWALFSADVRAQGGA